MQGFSTTRIYLHFDIHDIKVTASLKSTRKVVERMIEEANSCGVDIRLILHDYR